MKTTEKDIENGYKILSDVFDNNPFAELKSLRKTLWALDVKIHPELFTEAEIILADEILVNARNINTQIGEMTK